MATLPAVDQINITEARLPVAYEAARAALARCASIDECQTWKNKAQALASYARQAEDDTLHKTAVRIQSRAVRRCGELLKDYNAPGARTDLPQPPDVTVSRLQTEPEEPAQPRSATEAARQAGMSERQQVTAVRVANVPAELFEQAVESEAPPTVTALADMGRDTRPSDDASKPGFREQIELVGHARRLAEFAGKHEPAFVGPAVAHYNRRELRSYVARCRRFFDALAPFIREDRDGV